MQQSSGEFRRENADACVCSYLQIVVPAQAGTYNPRRE
jgi:hypothetical protein